VLRTVSIGLAFLIAFGFSGCDSAGWLERMRASEYVESGISKRKAGDSEGAVEDFNRAIRFNPKETTAYFERGLPRVDLGNVSGAIEDFSRVIQFDPGNQKAFVHRGNARRESGDT